MGLVQKLGINFAKSKPNPRLALVDRFKVRSMKMWENILKKNPVSFTNVRHPFERYVEMDYFRILILPLNPIKFGISK